MVDTKNFSVLDAAKGRSYPTDEAVVYTAVAEMHKYEKINFQANNAATGEETNTFDEQLKPLREAILASALTFHMRGFAPGVVQNINIETRAKFGEDADLDNGEPFLYRTDKYIAESIIKVTDVNDAVDEHRWSVDDVVALRGWLPEEEFGKIRLLMFLLTFRAWEFDQAVNADFS